MQSASDLYKRQIQDGEQFPAAQVTIDWAEWNDQHFPVLEAVTSDFLTNMTSITLPVPTGTTLGDVLVMVLSIFSTTAVTAPAGWTQKDTVACTGTGGHTLRVYWYRPAGPETGSYTWSWSGSQPREGRMLRLSGVVRAGDPFETTNAAQNSSASTSTAAVSVTPTRPRFLVWAGTANGGTKITPPSGYTDYAHSGSTGVGYLQQTGAAATGSLVGTIQTASVSTAWVGAVIEEGKPAPVVVDCDTITVERSITGGLPADVSLIAGVTAASATVTLTSDPDDNTQTPGVLYSPYQPAGTVTADRADRAPMTIQMGQVIGGKPELFTVLDGLVRLPKITVSPDGTTATVEGTDASDSFAFTPTFDLMVGNDPVIPISGEPFKPGLDVQRIVDGIARQAGYYASPPIRTNCVASAPLHGSAWPEVGTLVTASYWDSVSTSTSYPIRFAPANFALGLENQVFHNTGQGANNFAQWTLSRTVSQSDPVLTTILFCTYYEGWHYLTPTHNDELGAIRGTDNTRRIIWRTDGAGHLGLVWSRNGATTATSYPTTARITTSGWYYVAWHITYGSATSTIRIRVNSTTDTLTPATPTAWDSVQLSAVEVYNYGTEAIQVTDEQFDAAMWNDGFQPSAVLEPGLSELVALPPISTSDDAWTILQAVASATAATCLLDETGTFRWWNRQHWGKAGTAAGSVQKTLRTSLPVQEATIEQTTDRVRTIIRVGVTPYQITTAAVIWRLSEKVAVPARGTLVRSVDMSPNQAYQVDTSPVVIPSGGAIAHSGYRAAKNQDGTGGQISNLTMLIEPAAAAVKISFTNPNAFDAWLVSPTGAGYPSSSDGGAAAELWGRLITATTTALDTTTALASSTVVVEYRDTQAITDMGGSPIGERPLQLDASVWMQDAGDAYDLAQDLGFRLSRPCPQVTPVRIIADPTLQLGDMVLLIDDSNPWGNGLSATGLKDPYWVVGMTLRHDGTSATQDLVLRPVAPPKALLLGELGVADRATLDGRWHWA